MLRTQTPTDSINIPSRAGGLIPVKFVGVPAPVSVWLEFCLRLKDKRTAPMAGNLLNPVSNQWALPVTATFSETRYGQQWIAVICWQDTASGPIYEAVQPVRFGVDADYEPDEVIIGKRVTGEVIINIARVTVPLSPSNTVRREFPFVSLTNQVFTHDFGYEPQVTVLDGNGKVINACVEHLYQGGGALTNALRISANQPITGKLIVQL